VPKGVLLSSKYFSRMYKCILLSILLSITLCAQYGCTNNDKQQAEKNAHLQAAATTINAEATKLYNDAIAIHDEVMPKMGKMDELKEKLEQKLASKRFSTPADRTKHENAIKNLEKADDLMMEVMGEMKEPDAAIPADQAIKTMMELNKKANDMKNFMLKSISEAEALVK
jgi:hypothetical protein